MEDRDLTTTYVTRRLVSAYEIDVEQMIAAELSDQIRKAIDAEIINSLGVPVLEETPD